MRRVLVDAGPIVALLDRSDEHHDWMKQQFVGIKTPLLTCEAVVSEASFVLRYIPGGRQSVIGLFAKHVLRIAFDFQQEHQSVAMLIERYSQVPMSFADACLVRMAETFDDLPVLTLDGDFRIYRKHQRQMIPTILPDSQ